VHLLFSATLLLAAPARAETLHLVANYWEPFTGEQLEKQGAASDLVRTAMARSGYDVDIKIEPWARALNEIDNGHVDGVVAVWRTTERADHIAFSDAYFLNHLVLVARKERHFKFTSLADLTGLTIGVGRAYDYNNELQSADNFLKEPATTAELNFKKLSAGRIDLVLEDNCIAQYVQREKIDGFDFDRDLEIISPQVYDIPLYFGMSRLHPHFELVIESFNRALADMKKDGSYQAILANHHLGAC